MSRSNKNNRKKIRLSDNGNDQPLRCSSSSSSSNYSDDMDVIRNAVLESLTKKATNASKSTNVSSSKSIVDDEKIITTVDSYRATKQRSATSASDENDKMRTDVKIVRIKTLDSEESKLLLIVDVLDKNPFRIEVNSTAKRDEESSKCIKVDIEALKRGECPKEIRNLCTKVRSRRIYKLPDELMKKFDQKGLKVFEWHSFNRPDDVIKLLLDDSGVTNATGTATDRRKKMIIGFRKRSANITEDEPPPKIRRTGSSEAKVLSKGIRKARMAAEQRSRNRILQKLLKEYNVSGVWDVNQSKINRLVRSHLDSRAKEANERNNRRKELDDISAATTTAAASTREPKWKVENLPNFTSTVVRDHVEAANVLLNDDIIASVSNNSADVSAIDGNSDALDNSNNDDNDSKAKKKNRCALCRKKVGLTGFECRCGGLYCGIHRYSDKHNCTFDYRQLGAQEIRRNNPVVVGEKIQKI